MSLLPQEEGICGIFPRPDAQVSALFLRLLVFFLCSFRLAGALSFLPDPSLSSSEQEMLLSLQEEPLAL